jgi:acetylornithine deacetylase/succinyl-diaminopimelate desuccinylase-like protein
MSCRRVRDEWSVDPFAGEVKDGYVWGRGAVDMKDMDAMTLAVVREWQRIGRKPPRDIVLAFVADEEAGWRQGGALLSGQPPGPVRGLQRGHQRGGRLTASPSATCALPDPDRGEGHLWLRLTARARPGHASMLHDDNAVTLLADAVSRIGHYEFPVVDPDTVRRFPGRPGPAHRPGDRSGRSRASAAQARRHLAHDRRHAAQHRQPHDARRRIQGQRRPVLG